MYVRGSVVQVNILALKGRACFSSKPLGWGGGTWQTRFTPWRNLASQNVWFRDYQWRNCKGFMYLLRFPCELIQDRRQEPTTISIAQWQFWDNPWKCCLGSRHYWMRGKVLSRSHLNVSLFSTLFHSFFYEPTDTRECSGEFKFMLRQGNPLFHSPWGARNQVFVLKDSFQVSQQPCQTEAGLHNTSIVTPVNKLHTNSHVTWAPHQPRILVITTLLWVETWQGS